MKLEEILGESSFEKKLPIGEILLRRGQIRRYQLEFLLNLQSSYRRLSKKNILIGELLVKHRALVPRSLTDALSLQTELPHESVTQIISQMDLDSDDGEETKLLS